MARAASSEPADPAGSRSDVAGVRSVARALEILSLLSEERQSVTLREIVAETGLAKTTVLRLTQTLEQLGLLWAVPQGFVAGPTLWRWAHLTARTWEVQAPVKQQMRRLSDTHLETANLYVRRDICRVCVAQQESPQSLRHVVGVGDELPLWAGASARMLLIGAPDTLLGRVAGDSAGRTTAGTLAESAAQARADGFAVSRGEREAGITAVAVAVTGRSGAIVASLALSGPSTRFVDDRIPAMVDDLTAAAAQISAGGFDHPLATAI